MSLRVSNNNGYTIGYDDGINYADGRVNTSSINYQSGYNSGINYADGRVNTSSSSYTTGYNSGINYADGRVNTSSSSYTNGYSSGRNSVTDVSKLTTGERLLIGLLKCKITTPDVSIPTTTYAEYYVDFSKIANITISVKSPYGYGTPNGNIEYHGSIGDAHYVHNSVSIADGSSGVLSIPASINGSLRFFTEGGEVRNMYTITSFTTTDGKVHAADNLNY